MRENLAYGLMRKGWSLAASVKKDAVVAVKDQGAALYELVGNLGNVDALVGLLRRENLL